MVWYNTNSSPIAVLFAIIALAVIAQTAPAPDAASATTVTTASTTTTTTSSSSSEECDDTELEEDLNSFLDLLPADKIRNITWKAYLESASIRETFNFIGSAEFVDAKNRLVETPEVGQFLTYLNQSGVDLIKFVRKVGVRTGIPPSSSHRRLHEPVSLSSEEEDDDNESTEGSSAAVSKLLDRILAELPQEQIFTVFFEKLESSAEFSGFVERISSDEFETILTNIQVEKKRAGYRRIYYNTV